MAEASQTLAEQIAQTLSAYMSGVVTALNDAGKKAVQQMAQNTVSTAPYSAFHKASRPHFRDSIAWRQEHMSFSAAGSVFTWYVKPPNHSLTHLLENEHTARDGTIVPGRHFVRNAYQAVVAQYEDDIAASLKG